MDTLPFVFATGWASGINAYASLLVMGLLGRFAGFDSVPEGLQRNDVLLAAAVMFAIEFVTDKIPYVDSVWDAIHTAVRPSIGAVTGALIAGEATDLDGAVAAGIGGTTALLSHSVKAGVRLAVNLSPEPFSNIILSLAEDVAVVVMVVVTLTSPWVAAAIAAAMLLLGLGLLWLAMRAIRRFAFRRRREDTVK